MPQKISKVLAIVEKRLGPKTPVRFHSHLAGTSIQRGEHGAPTVFAKISHHLFFNDAELGNEKLGALINAVKTKELGLAVRHDVEKSAHRLELSYDVPAEELLESAKKRKIALSGVLKDYLKLCRQASRLSEKHGHPAFAASVTDGAKHLNFSDRKIEHLGM